MGGIHVSVPSTPNVGDLPGPPDYKSALYHAATGAPESHISSGDDDDDDGDGDGDV